MQTSMTLPRPPAGLARFDTGSLGLRMNEKTTIVCGKARYSEQEGEAEVWMQNRTANELHLPK